MFDLPHDLADDHAAALAAIPVPMTPACVRSLRTAHAREHIYAEAHRKSGQVQRSRQHNPRADRLTRIALRADARVADLAAEVR